MKLQHDRAIAIAVGGSRKDLNWQTQKTTVSALYTRCSTPVRGTETLAAYFQLKKAEQDDRKDVGGFVGGALSGGRRKATNIVGRDVITLDFDTIPANGTDAIISKLTAIRKSYAVYSTRKHMPRAPRLRVLMPLSRTVSVDEYEPIARYIANQISMQAIDPTTFEASRLMYWPSCCADGEFVFQYRDAEFVDADEVLATYTDWRDLTSWPTVAGQEIYQKLAAKQGDPESKPGVVGAFNRAHNVLDAMDTFLKGVYIPVDNDPHRFTYAGGSTAGGAIVYDDGKFLYSHHATDPTSGKLVNAFDLVRLHKFGDKDDDAAAGTPTVRLPSYTAMCEFATQDKATKIILLTDQQKKAQADYEGLKTAHGEEGDNLWKAELETDAKGLAKSTINNVLIILRNDREIAGKFALNEFSGRGEVLDALPWNVDKTRRMWSDTDSNGLYWYMETAYAIKGRGCIDSALDIYASESRFNEVSDYIEGLAWDGVERLDTMFIDYLGAADTPYTRAVTRKAFVAAIKRAIEPACKYDQMLILCGPQGIGKSTILNKMSRGWFNDSLRSFEGKEASELLQGVWIVEVAELDAFRRSDVAAIKQFLSLQVDRYRAAYGRHMSEFPRRCVFFGTCNEVDFLQDTTGNRRFWPVDVGETPRKFSPFTDLSEEIIDQMWAEAYTRYQLGEDLFLTGEVAEAAQAMQEAHREINPNDALVREFLERPIPEDWAEWDLDKRRLYWQGGINTDGIRLVRRAKVCAMEVLRELFDREREDIAKDQRTSRWINAVILATPGWKRAKYPTTYGRPYGQSQRGFFRTTDL